VNLFDFIPVRNCGKCAFVLLLSLAAFSVRAARAGTTADEQQLSTAIASGDSTARAAAIKTIRERLANDPRHAAATLNDQWMKALLSAGMYHEADELAQLAIVGRPRVSPLVASLQNARVQALVALGENEKALQAAKGYFNVSMMRDTEEAIGQLNDCLERARGAAVAKSFLDAECRAASKSGEQSKVREVLDTVKVDGAWLDAAIKQREGSSDYDSLVELCNLLLVADRTKEAREVFERAYQSPPHDGLVQAIENVARGMRAEDGGIQRANQWIQRLRQSGS
jgi:tetratricopeptide (TPR) repeat protein